MTNFRPLWNRRKIFTLLLLVILVFIFIIVKDNFIGTSTESRLKTLEEQKILKTKGEGYERFPLEGDQEVIVAYYPADYTNESLPPEKRGPGLLAFRVDDKGNIHKIWESTEKIFLTFPKITVRDITGDKRSEILALWSNGQSENLYIYSWDDATFNLISPFSKGSIVPVFNAREGGIEVKDIDRDGIEEVIVIQEKVLRFDEELLKTVVENYRQIYKFNGTEYYLWKEETVKE